MLDYLPGKIYTEHIRANWGGGGSLLLAVRRSEGDACPSAPLFWGLP